MPEEDHEGQVQMRRESMADMPVMHRDAGMGWAKADEGESQKMGTMTWSSTTLGQHCHKRQGSKFYKSSRLFPRSHGLMGYSNTRRLYILEPYFIAYISNLVHNKKNWQFFGRLPWWRTTVQWDSKQCPKFVHTTDLALLIAINELNDLIPIVPILSFEQVRKEVDIWLIICHLVLWHHPYLYEISMRLLQMEFQHLKCFHHERTNVVPLLGVCLSTRQKDVFARNGQCLDGQIVHCHGKHSWKSQTLHLPRVVSNVQAPLVSPPTSQNLRGSVFFGEHGAVM